MKSPDVNMWEAKVQDAALTTLGDFVAKTRYESLPERLREKARVRLLDGPIVSYIGRDNPVVTLARKFARSGVLGTGTGSYWMGDATGPADACAMVNSISMHALTHDDGGPGGHPSSNVIPAAVAVAEANGRSGRDLLAGIVVGYEIQARMAASGKLMKGLEGRGMRGTIVTGCFGAAAAAASALGLDARQSRSTIAFAASLASPGIENPIILGLSDERHIQLATDTRNGVLAALFARAGLVGSESALSGECGFFEVYLGHAGDEPEVTRGLGSEWRSDLNTARPYPTGGLNIGPVYSTLRIVAEHKVAAADVERVDVLHTWWRHNHSYVNPGPFESYEQAMLSVQFAIACCFLYGRFDWETVKSGLKDPNVAELARRVHVDGVWPWGATSAYARAETANLHGGAVTVTTRDGRQLRADAKNIPNSVLHPTWEEAVAKFNDLASYLPATRRKEIVDAVALVEDTGVVHLGEVLRRPVQ